MLVFGTRPEAIKMCPLVLELKKRKSIETIVCVTAQHRQTLFDITTTILEKIKGVLEEVKPDVVLVHGDTSTTFV